MSEPLSISILCVCEQRRLWPDCASESFSACWCNMYQKLVHWLKSCLFRYYTWIFLYLTVFKRNAKKKPLMSTSHDGSLRHQRIFEPVHEISNNVVCATSKASDQPAHTRSLIRAIASQVSILWLLCYWLNTIWSS